MTASNQGLDDYDGDGGNGHNDDDSGGDGDVDHDVPPYIIKEDFPLIRSIPTIRLKTYKACDLYYVCLDVINLMVGA